MGDLIERIHVRLGEESLVQARPIESHVPERAWEIAQAEATERIEEATKRRSEGATKCDEDPIFPSSLRRSVASSLPMTFFTFDASL